MVFLIIMRKIFVSFQNLELHHKVLLFMGEVFATILVARFFAEYYNVDPFILGFELHHFDYGVILLIISVLLLVLDESRKRFPLYFLLSAISLGLMTDELWFIRNHVVYPNTTSAQIYNGTFLSTLVIFLFISVGAGVINYLNTRN
jgi:hypothetical protein